MKDYIVYDFDGTIYNGDSSVDFFFFCLRRHPKALAVIPKFILSVLQYIFKMCSKEKMKENFFAVVKYVPDMDLETQAFWEKHQKKMYSWYTAKTHASDVIISASPEFLLIPIMQRFQVLAVIGSQVDAKSGKFLSPNCYGEEKVSRLFQTLGKITIREFYFDSKSDFPLAGLSIHSYRVRNGLPIINSHIT